MSKQPNTIGRVFTSHRTESGSWLAVLRISVSLALLLKLLNEWSSIDQLYGSGGLVPYIYSGFSSIAALPTLHDLYLIMTGNVSESSFIHGFFTLQIVATIGLLLGYQTRFFALLCWAMQVIVFNSTHLTSYGFDAVLLTLLFYAFIFPTGSYFSLDKKLKPEQYQTASELLPYYHKVVQLHVCLIYLATGIAKLHGQSWHDGSGLWDAINQPQFYSVLTSYWQRFFTVPGVAVVLGMGALLTELLFPVLIWVRGINKVMLLLIVLLHTFIAVVMGLWLFAFVMIAFDLAAFGHIWWSEES